MITFTKIRYKNLLSVGDVPIELQLTKSPTTLITSPNGSGKSILTEAVTMVLFDKSYRGLNKTAMVNSINKKDCLVTIWFEKGGSQYEVTRGISPNVFTIIKDGEQLDTQASTRDQQKWFEAHILGFTYRSFCQTCILGTASYEPFMQLSASARREVSETLLDIRIFSKMNAILKGRYADWKNQLSDIEEQERMKLHEIKVQKEFIEKVSQIAEEESAQLKKELAELKRRGEVLGRERAKAKSQINALQHDKSRLEKEYADQRGKLQSALSDFDSRLRSLEKELDFFTSHDECPTCSQDITEDMKRGNIKQLESDIQEIENSKSDISSDITALDEKYKPKIREVTDKLSDKQGVHGKAVGELDAVVKRAKQIMSDLNAEPEDVDDKVLEKFESELRQIVTQKTGLIKQKPVYDASLSLLKDTGIKSSIINKFVPILNHHINNYLGILNFNIHFEFDRNFSESIKSRYLSEFTYKNFSQGERQRLDLAVLFAWKEVSQAKNSVHCNLLILDEVFDASIDEEGTNDLMSILRKACKNNHVFIISHRGGMEGRLMDTIKFRKINGFTRLDS